PGGTRMRVTCDGNSVNPTTACDVLSSNYSENEDYVLSILGGVGYNFAWTGAGLNNSAIFNPVATLGSPSTLYSVVVTDPYGCYSGGSVTLSEPASNPGNTISTTGAACVSQGFTLSTQFTPAGANYQWQSSPNGTTWTDVGGQTGTTYAVASQTVATYYRCVVGCTSGGTPTTPIQVTQNPFYNCYCTPVYTYGCGFPDVITNVTFDAINNTTGTTCGQGTDLGYDPVFTSPNPAVFQNNTYSLSVSTGGDNEGVAAWIDYNHSGTFDPSEEVLSSPAQGNPFTHTANVTIPGTALGGQTQMRVRCIYSTNPTGNPCGSTTYGETEDYRIIIGDPNCVAAPIYPPDGGQICPDPALSLSWAANPGATGYDIYFDSSNPPTTLVASGQSGTSFSPPSLSSALTYYWKVVPIYSSGSCTTPQVFSFSFKAAPIPFASSNAPVCEGFQLALFGDNTQNGTGNSYAWTGPNSYTSGVQNPSISSATATNGGIYTLTVTNSLGCTATTTYEVIVNPNPVLSIASQTSVSCNGDVDGTVDIDASTGTPDYLYDLDFGNITLDGQYSGLAPGIHYADVTDNNGCVAPEI
ncbi:MAG: GEVED domain-containing protein, partial [Bacteroidota bacterium]